MTREESSALPVAGRDRAPGARRGNVAWLVAGALLAATALLGCANAAAVKTKSVPIVGMAGFHTYDWGTPEPVVVAEEDRERYAAVLEYTVRNAVDQQLAAKGYRRVESGERPDFVVDFGIRLEEKSTETFGEYIKYRDQGGKQALGPAFVFGYEQGSVAIEVTDARTETRAWTGSARTVFDDGQDVVKLEGAIARIMADFPNAGGAKAPVKVNLDSQGMFHAPVP